MHVSCLYIGKDRHRVRKQPQDVGNTRYYITYKAVEANPVRVRLATGRALDLECVVIWVFGGIFWLEVGDSADD